MIPFLPSGYRPFKVGEYVRLKAEIESTDHPAKKIKEGSRGKIISENSGIDIFTVEFESSLRAWVTALMMPTVFEHAGPVIEERPLPPQLRDWYKQTQKHMKKKS